jgi:hypothetical protein
MPLRKRVIRVFALNQMVTDIPEEHVGCDFGTCGQTPDPSAGEIHAERKAHDGSTVMCIDYPARLITHEKSEILGHFAALTPAALSVQRATFTFSSL